MAKSKMPVFLLRKFYKTGQTRGADDDEIYQNRVSRNSTVLIPYVLWKKGFTLPPEGNFENGFIVLIAPKDFFEHKDPDRELKQYNLKLGHNALVFYETRSDWNKYNPEKIKWVAAKQRTSPLGGNYIARISATTATEGGDKIVHGFTKTAGKGAGIRVFEYASTKTVTLCRSQLEALFWMCFDSSAVMEQQGMTKEEIRQQKEKLLHRCSELGLLNYSKLISMRLVNEKRNTICPLCLEQISSSGFLNRLEQAIGREVLDLTVTQINLFHVNELRVGVYNHSPYNLGWGHHHCNVVARDVGIKKTLDWMENIVNRNKKRVKIRTQ